jgi:hypothetical protein
MELCRGRELRPPRLTARLRCFYAAGRHPLYRVGPLRLEVVSLLPRIVILHNFIPAADVEMIKAAAAPKLRRSEMVGKSVNGSADDRRVSETAWLIEGDTPALQRLTDRSSKYITLTVFFCSSAAYRQVLGTNYTYCVLLKFSGLLKDRSSEQITLIVFS